MKVVFVNPFQMRPIGRKGRIYNRTWTPLELANGAPFFGTPGTR